MDASGCEAVEINAQEIMPGNGVKRDQSVPHIILSICTHCIRERFRNHTIGTGRPLKGFGLANLGFEVV